MQLGISAGSWALSSLTASLGNAGLLERNQDVGAHTAKALQAAVVLQVSALPHAKCPACGLLIFILVVASAILLN